MTTTDLLLYIYENNKTEYVLEDLKCHDIKENNNEWRCGLPNHHNKTSVVVKKNEYLNVIVYRSENGTFNGNLITLIMFIKNYTFVDSNRYLHSLLNLEYKFNKKNKNKTITPVDIFISKKRNKYNNIDIDLYDKSILEEYTPNLHTSWLREGILSFTAREFDIGYDYKRSRIIIPHKMWHGEDDKIAGIIGRTTIPNYDLLDIPKYFHIKSYPKSYNLYGLYENYKYIQQAGYVSVFEAEKSTLKRHSRLDKTGVSLCCHDISREQEKILIGLNVEIVIIMDKGITIEHIWSLCEKFYNIRKVSYIYDKYNIIKDKDSPADLNDNIYTSLFNHRKIYDASDRKEYYKWLGKPLMK